MAVTKKVVKKPATVAAAPQATKKVVTKAAPAAPAKKTVEAPAKKTVAKAAPAKKTVEAPAKKSVAKPSVAKTTAPAKKSVAKPSVAKTTAPAKGGKKSLKKSTSAPKTNLTLVKGKQATQEQFVHLFQQKLTALEYEVSKKDTEAIQKAYSETLKEVTNLCSFQDTTAGIYYARREINTRVTQPPKAEGGLQTLMLKHYELKVRKLLDNEEDIKFFGHISEDDENIFVTVDGQEIDLTADVEPEEEVVDEEATEAEEVEADTEEEVAEDEEAVEEEEVAEDEEAAEEELDETDAEEEEEEDLFEDEE